MNKRLAKRKCELWISNNKVLGGGGGKSKKPHARNPNFETEETKLLISLWGDPIVQKTLITTHKKHPVIQKLADKMREHGYYRSAEEINTRIKNLKCFYNRIKKDVELGVISEPTWKHYAAMEEIITRPVFGNRIQQPHLYNAQQQQQKSNSQEAKYSWIKKMEAEEDSNELRPEDLLSVEEEPDDDDDDDANDYDDDDEAEMDFEEASLVPKEEPIDIEDEAVSDVADADDIFPKLSQYLQLASNQQIESSKMREILPKISEIKIKQSPPSTPPTPATTPTPMSTVTAITSTTAPVVIKSATTQQPSKISLVPTNILMKPTVTTTTSSTSLPQSSLNFSPQLFCAKSASGTQTVYTTTSNGVPMKVLLVNALQTPKRLPTQQTPPLLLPKTVTSTSTKLTTTTVDSSKSMNKLSGSGESLSHHRNGIAGGNVQLNKSFAQRDNRNDTRGFKGLLHRLINIQNETLGINKQRLKIERQRFEFEQNIGKKLLTVLTKMASNSSANETCIANDNEKS